MKKNTYLSITTILAAVLLLASSCKENTEDLPQSMQATLNSEKWQANQTSAVITNGSLALGGITTDGQVLNIVCKAHTNGRQTIDQNSGMGNIAQYSLNSALYSSMYDSESGGWVEITEIDQAANRISGSFSLLLKSGAGEQSFEEGRFDALDFSVIGSLEATDSFTAKIDGETWEALVIDTNTNNDQLSIVGIDAFRTNSISLSFTNARCLLANIASVFSMQK